MNKKQVKPLSLKLELLIVLIPLIFVYTWVITAVNSGYIMSSTRDTLSKTLTETVQITAEHISESIDTNVKMVKLLAVRIGAEYSDIIKAPYDKNSAEGIAFAKTIADMSADYGFLHMMVANGQGFTMTSVNTDLRDKAADYYLAIVDDKKSSFVSDVTVDKGTFAGKYVLNYTAPIYEGDELIGVLICKSDAEELCRLVKAVSVGEGGSTFIMDSIGQCIAHADENMRFSGDKYIAIKNNTDYATLNALWDDMAKINQGYTSYDYNGKRLAAYARIEGTNNWSIAVTVAENEFMQGAVKARNTVTWLSLGMIIIVIGLLILLLRYLTRNITVTAARLESLAEGDLNGKVIIDRSSDETYRLTLAAAKLINTIQVMINETEYTLAQIAEGNLTVTTRVEYPGDFLALKQAIEINLKKLNEIMQRISRASEEVARGSAQMASGATGLAQGASEQASSLEELFETVTTLTQRTNEIGGINKRRLNDIDGDDELDGDGTEALKRFEAADTLAEKLIIAIKRIAETSGSIQRIAADIEAISSETGMLALNASVEATHAGEAGRGFAVIAGEIRSLSDKSRNAAKEADGKIERIGRAVARGTQTVELTVSTIGEMSLAMEQVKSALEQISNIVENIAATAEETAAGSEELSGQAEVLKLLVSEFKYHTDDGEDA